MTTTKNEGMRAAAEILKKIYHSIEPLMQPGITGLQVDNHIRNQLLTSGATSCTNGYWPPGTAAPFRGNCCIAINEVAAHAPPGPHQLFSYGDIVSVDIAIEYRGWCADACRTYMIGPVSDSRQALAEAAADVTLEIIKHLRPGVSMDRIGRYTQHIVNSKGYYVLPNFGGHGIGRTMHEAPFTPCRPNGDLTILRRGDFITIEPIITIEPTRICLDPDGWTLYTVNGLPCAQHEHTLMITDDGAEILV